MSDNGTLTTDELRELTGKQRPSAIERWLRENGIQYWLGAHGPFTTVAMLHASRGYLVDEERSKWEHA